MIRYGITRCERQTKIVLIKFPFFSDLTAAAVYFVIFLQVRYEMQRKTHDDCGQVVLESLPLLVFEKMVLRHTMILCTTAFPGLSSMHDGNFLGMLRSDGG